MNTEQENRIVEIFSQVLEIPSDEIVDTVALNDNPSWDSLRHLQLVSELETEFGIELELDDIYSMTNLGMVRKVVNKYLEK